MLKNVFTFSLPRAATGCSSLRSMSEGKCSKLIQRMCRSRQRSSNMTVTAQGGQWVVLMPALQLPPHSTQEPGAKVNDRTAKHIGVDTPLDSQPYFAIWNAQGKWQPGWVPSIADVLAEDWTTIA